LNVLFKSHTQKSVANVNMLLGGDYRQYEYHLGDRYETYDRIFRDVYFLFFEYLRNKLSSA